MANFKITDLTLTNLPTEDSVIPCINNGVSKQISILQIKQYINQGTVREVSSGSGLVCSPNPITVSGSISFSCPGLMSIYAGSSDPSGWLICNGRSLATASYPDLFNRIGYTYGGSGSTFNLPNVSGRSVFGMEDMGAGVGSSGRITLSNATTLGSTAGAIQHTLTVSQAPLLSHTHSISGSFSVPTDRNRTGNNSNLSTGSPRSNFNTTSGEVCTSLPLTIQTSSDLSAGSSASAHPNVPPFLLLNWIIKI